MQLKRFIPCLLLVGLLACQKPMDGLPNPDAPATNPGQTGVVYEKGTSVGQAVQKTIGPEGGTLVSADGVLNMTVPAGAVSQATTFSVQPITPTLPGLLGRQAYRLLPEGQTFAQPVSLRFQYDADSLDGTSAQLLFMAYQGSDGYWKALPDTELDETAHTLTVKTKHFSDWGAFSEFYILAERDYLQPGESTKLRLTGYFDDFNGTVGRGTSGPVSEQVWEVVLSQQKTLASSDNIKNWRVMGDGDVNPDAAKTSAVYSVPAGASGGVDVVAVDVYNFIPAKYRPRQGGTGKAVILKKIYIEGAYFELTIDGKTHELRPYGVVNENGIIFGAPYENTKAIQVQIRSKSVTASKTIPYEPLHLGQDGKAEIYLSDGSPYPWVSWYSTCDGGMVPSGGGIQIESFKVTNGKRYIRGSLSGTVYGTPDFCRNIQAKKFKGVFNIALTGG